jgi:hypothetical protein
VAGSAAYPGLFSLAGAVRSATGLSLRSPRTARDLFRARATPWCRLRRRSFFLCPLKNILAARAARLPSRPITSAFLSGAGTHHNQDPATGTTLRREHDMDAICSQCHGPAPDGPVFAEAGLLCWPCADARIDALRLLWDPAGDLDLTAA